jgi:hypothetical protein
MARPTLLGMSRKDRIEVLVAIDGLELVRYADGTRELRFSDRALDNLDAAFDAIVAATWVDFPVVN